MLFKHFPREAQRELSLELLTQLGYDFDAGRLDESVHPFMIGLNYGDARITTKYDENDFRSAILARFMSVVMRCMSKTLMKNLLVYH